MANPQREIPEAATNREPDRPESGEEALRAALAEHGGDYADALDHTDELQDALATAVLVVASADEEDVDRVTDSLVSATNAAEALTTEESVALAEHIGENGGDLAQTVDVAARLQREGHLETFVTIAETFSEDLDEAERDELVSIIEDGGAGDLVAAVDAVTTLQRDGHLEELVDLAGTLSTLDVSDQTAAGLNDALSAVGEARQTAEPIGPLGAVRALTSADGRAGLGYAVAVLKSLGQSIRE